MARQLTEEAKGALTSPDTASGSVTTGDQRSAFAGPQFSTQWEREDYEREQRGERALGPFASTAPLAHQSEYQRGWDDCFEHVLKVLGENFTRSTNGASR